VKLRNEPAAFRSPGTSIGSGHTFSSHLAMRGAPAKAIQELAGHADLSTTMRYRHPARGSKEAAIAMLEQGARGAGVEQKSNEA
jgi:integrase